jgi:putative ABC transport system permease protein
VGDVAAMPGMRRQEPTVYVSSAVVDRLPGEGFSTEVWMPGDRDELLAALDRSGTRYQEVRTLAGIADRASFHTVSWTFGFLTSIGVAASLLVLGGLAVHLDAQRRQRVLGYAFMRRMGLRRAQHRRAVLVELAASVVVGALLGLVMAGVAAGLAHERIDPVGRYAPEPLLRHATPTIIAVAIATALLAAVAATVGQRRMDRDDPLEVLRAGT